MHIIYSLRTSVTEPFIYTPRDSQVGGRKERGPVQSNCVQKDLVKLVQSEPVESLRT